MQILNLCTLLFYEDFSTFWTFDDFYDCCVFVALAFWIFWHVCIELWYFHAEVWLKMNLAKLHVFKLSIVHVSSNYVTFILKKPPFLLNQVARKDRLVSKLFCAYYIVQVCFVSASILFWNVSDQRLTTFGWFNIGSGNFNVS